MPGRLHAYVNSLGGRLLLRILLALAAVLAVYLFLAIKVNRGFLLDLTYHNAQRTAQLIERATRYGMLLNRKEDVHETIRRISETPDVAAIRIFDKNGAVIFSTDENDVGQRVDLHADACLVCHDAAGEPAREVPDPPVREIRRDDGQLAVGLIHAIRNADECSSSQCHVSPSEQSVLGVLDVQMSLGTVQQALTATSKLAVWLTLLLATVLVGVCAVFIHRVVRRPIQEIERGIAKIASGNLESPVHTPGTGELASLAADFNRMTEDLKRARDELTRWSHTLEEKVLEKTRELNRTQQQIVQVEKMVSLGRLSATVAHELNNPLSGILTYAKLVAKGIDGNDEESAELRRYLHVIQEESARCGDIVRNLLVFARKTSAEFQSERLNQIIERSLMLVRHSIDLAEIQLEYSPCDGDDRIVCDANQVKQAVVAILLNAVESMPSGGRLAVSVLGNTRSLTIVVRDTGVGIAAEALPLIFEPFFSTKNERVGAGLGLSVVYGIVRRHGGNIDVQSIPDSGTTVAVVLPRRPPPASANEAEQSANGSPSVSSAASREVS